MVGPNSHGFESEVSKSPSIAQGLMVLKTLWSLFIPHSSALVQFIFGKCLDHISKHVKCYSLHSHGHVKQISLSLVLSVPW